MARRLSTSRMLTLASPDYLARHGRPELPQDLAAHHCLGYTASTRSIRRTGRASEAAGLRVVPRQGSAFDVGGKLTFGPASVLITVGVVYGRRYLATLAPPTVSR